MAVRVLICAVCGMKEGYATVRRWLEQYTSASSLMFCCLLYFTREPPCCLKPCCTVYTILCWDTWWYTVPRLSESVRKLSESSSRASHTLKTSTYLQHQQQVTSRTKRSAYKNRSNGNGIELENYYVQSFCTPTRVALMAGRDHFFLWRPSGVYKWHPLKIYIYICVWGACMSL